MNGDDGVTMPGQIQDMRVDNWGNYCLQRLHSMYEKGELCDLTIQFHNNQILKVHRVVMNMCTEYFSDLERTAGLKSGMLVLPEEIEYQALSTIIKFFYTGRLEVRGNQFLEIFKTVRLLNVAILLKLLEAQAKKPAASKQETSPTAPVNSIKTSKLETSTVTAAPGDAQARLVKANLGQGQTIVRPLRQGQSLTTKAAVLARVQGHPINKRLGPTILANATNGKHVFKKKLPIWKERKFSPITNTQAEQSQKWSVKDEPARPTRFEWPELDDDTHTAAKSTKDIRSETKDLFDAIRSQNSISTTDNSLDQSSSENPGDVIIDPIERELAEMEKADDEAQLPTEVTQVNVTHDTTEENDSSVDDSQSILVEVSAGSEVNAPDHVLPEAEGGDVAVVSTPSTSTSSQLENLRLNENNDDDEPMAIEYHEAKSDSESPLSHSRIISEVFKAYPDLVKDSRNIKLKIVQKNSPQKLENIKETKSKVSYIILKSTSSNDCLASPLLAKKNSRLSKRAISTTSTFWDPPNKAAKPTVSPAENLEGPWICDRCTSDSGAIEFESYYTYRKHLVEVHGDRIDARICEHCGYKASKRNLLLYHLYTKHGVPPRNCSFPHCDQCSYVGLTESLLTKHKQIHMAPGRYICQGCKSQFVSSSLLKLHVEKNANCANDAKFQCTFCVKRFTKSINLKNHMQAVHKQQAKAEEDAKSEEEISFAEAEEEEESITLILPGGVAEEAQYLDASQLPESQIPSSEAEALTNVASSIAASLDLEAGTQHFTTAEISTEDPSVQQTIYIMDSSATNLHALESQDANAQAGTPCILQDEDGNKYEQVTGYDEFGQQVIYFQPAQEIQQYPVEIKEPVVQDVETVASDETDQEQGQGAVEVEESAIETIESTSDDFQTQNVESTVTA